MLAEGSIAILAVVAALGLSIAGWFVGHAFIEARRVDRFVTVKGLAERDVAADLALWPFQIVATDDDLGRDEYYLYE